MSLSTQEVIAQVRRDLSDAVAPYRWGDTELLRHVTTGRNEIVRQRPDSLYVGDSIEVTPIDDLPDVTALTGAGSETSISVVFFNALAHYVAYCVLLGDAEDASNQKLAQYHWEQFVKEIG